MSTTATSTGTAAHHLVHVGEVRHRKLLADALGFRGDDIAHGGQLCPRNLLTAQELRMTYSNSTAAYQRKA